MKGVLYPNNSVINITDIGKKSDALYCLTNATNCRHIDMPSGMHSFYYPNNDVILNTTSTFYITRGHKSLLLHRNDMVKLNGIYRCLLDNMEVYFGIYSQTDGNFYS